MRFLPTYLFVAILVLCLGIFVSTKTSPAQNTPEPADIKLTNKTNLQVIKAKREKKGLLLTFQNNYSKRITAFVVTIGHFRFTEDFVSNEVSDDFGINPNGSLERRIPILSSNANDAVIHATLQAVIFDDKSGDGDPVIFEDMRDDRLGQAIQIRRSLKILERYVHLDKFDTSQLKSDLNRHGPPRKLKRLLSYVSCVRSVRLTERVTARCLPTLRLVSKRQKLMQRGALTKLLSHPQKKTVF